MGYFMPSHQEARYVEPWEDRLKSCLVIDLNKVEFAGDQARGFVFRPGTTSGFYFTWDRFLGRYVYQEGQGFLTRWDNGDYMLIIPLEDEYFPWEDA